MTKFMKQDLYRAVGFIINNIFNLKSEIFFSQLHCILTH